MDGKKGERRTGRRGVGEITGIGGDWEGWRRNDHDCCHQWLVSSSHCLAALSCQAGRTSFARFQQVKEKLNHEAGEREQLKRSSCVCRSKQCGHKLKQSGLNWLSRQHGPRGQRERGQASSAALQGAACWGAGASCCQCAFRGRGVRTGHSGSSCFCCCCCVMCHTSFSSTLLAPTQCH